MRSFDRLSYALLENRNYIWGYRPDRGPVKHKRNYLAAMGMFHGPAEHAGMSSKVNEDEHTPREGPPAAVRYTRISMVYSAVLG